jgi:RNA polymerase sigma-70 factor (ECF subfamily)
MKLQLNQPHIIIGMMQEDRQALRHIRQGDIDWYGVLVKKYTGRIHQYVSSRLFDKAEADDIVQKTFINFYRAINRFDEKKEVLPYLYEIAKNELKMFFRSHREALPLNDALVGETPPVSVDEAELDDILQGVAPDQRKALRMLYEGYSYKEIANALKRPINTVRTLIRRARLLLTVQKKP